MKKDYKYIGILSGTILVVVFMEILSPKTIDWTVTLASTDKRPFGSFLIEERMNDLFEESSTSHLTLYELADSSYHNIFILTQKFEPGEADVNALLNYVNEGKNALIVANRFYGKFADTLAIQTIDYLFQNDIFANLDKEDTSALTYENPVVGDNKYYYQRNNSAYYFNEFDSARSVVVGTNDLNRPNFLSIPWGKGHLFICSTPLAFTNNYFVYENNNEYVSKAFSYLDGNNIHWTEFYQLGRMEARTPLRFILSEEGLSWAYYIAIISLLLFMLFEAKRKQRIIPVIEPLKNETLTFVGTIGNLYYQNKAHKSIAIKKINFFMDKLRRHYYINVREGDRSFINQVAHKTGNDEKQTKKLFDTINNIKNQPQITEDQLLDLNKKIERFKMN